MCGWQTLDDSIWWLPERTENTESCQWYLEWFCGHCEPSSKGPCEHSSSLVLLFTWACLWGGKGDLLGMLRGYMPCLHFRNSWSPNPQSFLAIGHHICGTEIIKYQYFKHHSSHFGFLLFVVGFFCLFLCLFSLEPFLARIYVAVAFPQEWAILSLNVFAFSHMPRYLMLSYANLQIDSSFLNKLFLCSFLGNRAWTSSK